MKREEAIKRLHKYAKYAYDIWNDGDADAEAFDMAIEALSADTVSREQYDHVCEEYNRLVHKAICIKLCDENCEYEKGKTCFCRIRSECDQGSGKNRCGYVKGSGCISS